MTLFGWKLCGTPSRMSLEFHELDPIACFFSLWPGQKRHIAFGFKVSIYYGGKPWRVETALLRIFLWRWQFAQHFRRAS